MLDPWIIEEILRREEESRRQQEEQGRVIPIPLEPPRYRERSPDGSRPDGSRPDEESNRGVIVIDI